MNGLNSIQFLQSYASFMAHIHNQVDTVALLDGKFPSVELHLEC